MKQYVLALGFLAAQAAPLLAEGLAFQPVAPEGLTAKAADFVAAYQEGVPRAFAIFEENGFGAFGAFAVPQGEDLDETKVSVTANAASTDEAGTAALDACKAATGKTCTLIGYLVPTGN